MAIYELSIQSSHLVYAEVIAVTSAMRKNSRWSSLSSRGFPSVGSSMGLRRTTHQTDHRPRDPHPESDLMGGFEQLKRALRSIQTDVRQLPVSTLLGPFLDIIRSPLSTGPISSTALASLHTFLVYGLVSPTAADIHPALTALSNTISHIQFEGSDPASDEILLFRMLAVIDACMTGPLGPHLGDVQVCELLEAVLTICCQMRRSEILRRAAAATMHSLARTVFSKLNTLDPEEAERQLRQQEESETSSAFTEKLEPETGTSTEPHPPAPPYGLLSIRELIRVVVNLLDPTDPVHTDSIRLAALDILNVVLQVSGNTIGSFPSLYTIMTDKGCKFLFQLARSDNLLILQLSLRVISLLFDTMRQHLKLQQELFISFTLDRLASFSIPNPPTLRLKLGNPPPLLLAPQPHLARAMLLQIPPEEDDIPRPYPRLGVQPARGETRELLLETLGHLARQPSFFGDLWVNYDCDMNCEDLFERLVAFLTSGVYADQYPGVLESHQYTSQLMRLDLLLTFIDQMASRAEYESSAPPSSDFPKPEQMNRLKAQKKLLLTGTARFNSKPKSGLAFLEENGLIYSDSHGKAGVPRAQSLAMFLKNAPRLDKKLVGEYLSKAENVDVLKAFIGLYDFRNKSIAEAMREMLESFRLPGEAQQIERITSTFAEIFFASEPAGINSQDAVFVLAFAVIMLNTDLHSPNIRKRMTAEDFQRNLRGVNFGSDFAPEYLQNIYDTIRKREIIMPEEHTGQAGFDYAWKELSLRSKTSGPLIVCHTDIFDETMFKLAWKPIVSSIASAFETFEDEYVVQKVITGFRQCATLAGKFHLPEVFDYVVMSLSHATGLLQDDVSMNSGHPVTVNFPEVEVDGQTVTVSSLAIRFGTSFRGQLAAVVLFNIANGNGNAIRGGWTQIFEMFQTLFLHSLLPTRMLQTEDFLGGVSMIPMQGNASTPTPVPARSDGGLLSTLSSYLLTPYGPSTEVAMPEVTDRDVENTLSAIDCIAACRLHELYTQIMLLDWDALVAVVKALTDLADRRTIRLLARVSENNARYESPAKQLPYDPASVFLLETMVSITVQKPDNIEDIWPLVFQHISGLLSSAVRFSVLLIERTVVGLLRIALILAAKPSLRDQLYIALDLLGSLPPVIVSAVAEQLTAGIALIIKQHRDVISSSTEWGLVFALIKESWGLISILEEFAYVPGRAVAFKSDRRTRTVEATPLNPNLERGLKAIDLLFTLKGTLPRWIDQSSLPREQAWKAGWTPLLVAIGRQCAGLIPEMRHLSLNCLQRVLLGPHILAQGNAAIDVIYLFDHVVFPMVDDLLRPELDEDARHHHHHRGPLSESRLKASTLLCKSFLHFEIGSTSTANPELRELWLIVLDFSDRLMRSCGRQDQLFEAVPESIKNLVLVMHASGILVPPPAPPSSPGGLITDSRDEEQRLMWNETLDRMTPFIPGFLEDLIPSPPPPTSSTSAPPLNIKTSDSISTAEPTLAPPLI
ncbi:hypothetical protein BS47DRAFT_1379647 [Hydnum rufescens UP504]|uniref:SEC7 domain-containing protein n=1 Tax=Hydnum rufescens UP504 TaxID=1448309 RepID=A0A9P6E1Q2_9AGAM|nr:hypothetical protein BS47DRAFT_1379647 [Hydnum rufescens UP504]